MKLFSNDLYKARKHNNNKRLTTTGTSTAERGTKFKSRNTNPSIPVCRKTCVTSLYNVVGSDQ